MSEKQPENVIAGYLQKLEELTASEGSYAYRGQENADWKVESGALRRIKEKTNLLVKKTNLSKEDFISYHEKVLLEPARMDRYGVEDSRELSDLELLAKLQHYGAATCLIDFTRNFFVAMWFACQHHKEKDGKIFILNTGDEKNFLSLEGEDLEKKVRPILTFQIRDEIASSKETTILSGPQPSWWHWSPQGLVQRILKQDSLFIFGQPKIEGALLQEIKISHGDKYKILKEIERLVGITERALFKDLPGFATIHGHNKFLPPGYGNAEYYLRKGNEALQREDFEGAVADYNETIKHNPDYVEAYNNRGSAKSNLGDLNGAIADLDRAIELKPDSAVAYYNRGDVKSNLGDHRGAIADYDRAIELNPDFTEAYNNRGKVKSDSGDPSGAMVDYDRAIELNPDFAGAYFNRGIVNRSLGHHSEAIEDYNRAIELNPDDAKAYSNRGNVKADLGYRMGAIVCLNDLMDAIADYNRTIELEPDFAVAYNNRGNINLSLGRRREAITDYNRAVELKSDDANVYYNRGLAKADLGDYSGAMADYDRALELKPDFEKVYDKRGIVKAILDEHSEAIVDFNRAIKLKPDYANAYYNRGLTYTSLGDKEKLGDKKMARRDFLKARELAEQRRDVQLLKVIDEALSKLDNENNNRS